MDRRGIGDEQERDRREREGGKEGGVRKEIDNIDR